MFDESFNGSFEHDTVAVFIFQKEFVEFGFHFHFYFFFYNKYAVVTYIIVYIWIFAISWMGKGESYISGFVPRHIWRVGDGELMEEVINRLGVEKVNR